MKKLKLILAAFLGLALAACGTAQKDFYAFQGEILKQSVALAAKDKDLAIEREKTRQKQYDAMIAVKDKFDAGGVSAFAISANLSGALEHGVGGGKADQGAALLTAAANMRPPESTEDKAFKWAGLILGGGRLAVDRLNSRDATNAARDTTLGLYSMISTINRDTGQAVAGAVAPFASTGPTNSYAIDITNSQGVALLGSTATWQQPTTINVDCASGASGAGGTGATGGAGGTATPPAVPAPGGVGGAGAPSGATGNVPCTVQR